MTLRATAAALLLLAGCATVAPRTPRPHQLAIVETDLGWLFVLHRDADWSGQVRSQAATVAVDLHREAPWAGDVRLDGYVVIVEPGPFQDRGQVYAGAHYPAPRLIRVSAGHLAQGALAHELRHALCYLVTPECDCHRAGHDRGIGCRTRGAR